MDPQATQALQELQTEVAQLRQRGSELTQTVQLLAAPTSPLGSTGDGGALAELVGAQSEN